MPQFLEVVREHILSMVGIVINVLLRIYQAFQKRKKKLKIG